MHGSKANLAMVTITDILALLLLNSNHAVVNGVRHSPVSTHAEDRTKLFVRLFR